MTWQSIYNYSVYNGLDNKRYNSRLGNIKSYCPSAHWVAGYTIILAPFSQYFEQACCTPVSKMNFFKCSGFIFIMFI